MSDNRGVIRVFVTSTFHHIHAERGELVKQVLPQLRRLFKSCNVTRGEVGLSRGIAEEQATHKETRILCLDEIRAFRTFFIGLLGERYGWTPGADSFSTDLEKEQLWLRSLAGTNVTELEISYAPCSLRIILQIILLSCPFADAGCIASSPGSLDFQPHAGYPGVDKIDSDHCLLLAEVLRI